MRTLAFLALALTGCTAGPVTVESPLALNEFLASNLENLVDEAGGTPDWLELFNGGAEDASLDGWFISDNLANPQRQSLDGFVVPAGGVLLLHASGDTTLGDTHLGFRLKMAGEELVLTGPDGVVDKLTFGSQISDTSTARVPDGTGDWVAGQVPTPGELNE